MAGRGLCHVRLANPSLTPYSDYRARGKFIVPAKILCLGSVIHAIAEDIRNRAAVPAGIAFPVVSHKLELPCHSRPQIGHEVHGVFGGTLADKRIDNQLGVTVNGDEHELRSPILELVNVVLLAAIHDAVYLVRLHKFSFHVVDF